MVEETGMKRIEFVSDFHTGAALAEIVAKEHLKLRGLSDDLDVTSSGLFIKIPDTRWTYDLVVYILEHGAAFDTSPIRVSQQLYDTDPIYKSGVDQHAKRVYSILRGIDVTHSSTIRRLIGDRFSCDSKQTGVDNAVALILTLRDVHLDHLESIYAGRSCPPHASLGSYTKAPGEETREELPFLHKHAIGAVVQQYISVLERIVPRAIDRFVDEHYRSP